MLEVDNVEITYDDVILAVKGVSLRVPEGKIVTLLGANGAGKSTVLKAISGVLKSQEGKIESGKITYYQKPLNGVSPEKIVRMGISQVPEGRRVFQDLTCQENLRVGSFTRKNSIQVQEDMEKILGYFPALRKSLPVKAGYLSGGEQQMLAIGRALMSRPRFMLLDEPSLGLAPLLVKEIFSIIETINRKDAISVLLVEQNANIALQTASHGYIMETGRIVMDDPCDRLRQNEDVMEFYLGITAEGGIKSFADVKHYKRRKRWLS